LDKTLMHKKWKYYSIIEFECSNNSLPSYTYKLSGENLKQLQIERDLGVLINSSLSYK
jgi:hypothetical protein